MRKVRLSVKLMVSFMSVALLVLLVGLLGIKGELDMRAQLVAVGEELMPAIQQLNHLNIERLQIRAQTLEIQSHPVWQPNLSEVFAQLLRQRAASWTNFEAALASYEKLPFNPSEKAVFGAFQGEYTTWRGINQQIEARVQDLMRTTDQEFYTSVFAAYAKLVKESFLLSDRVGVLIESMVALNSQSAKSDVTDALDKGHKMVLLTSIGIGFGQLLAVFLGLFMTRDTLRQLGGEPAVVAALVERVAQGDLTVQIERRKGDDSSLLAAFAKMVTNIQRVLREVSSASTQVAAAAEQLSATSAEMREQVRLEQSETDQVATAMNEMTATVEEVARNAAEAARAAQETDRETDSGSRVVTQTIAAIESVAQEVEAASLVIARLSEDSSEIGAVLDVIRGVAEQTNLLALNAAIEAARAGEQGRGFAVVASEVRTLASRTQASIQDIQEKIERVQSGSLGAVQVMQKGQAKARESVAQARRAGESLTVISVAITSISDMNRQIASAAEEQTAVAEEINRNIHVITGTVDQTAAGSAQIAHASDDLARLAAQLQDRVGQFRI